MLDVQEAWSHATARASGQKILDNPKLLKKSLKRDMQLKAKRSKAWKARVEKQVKDTKRRQDKCVGGGSDAGRHEAAS